LLLIEGNLISCFGEALQLRRLVESLHLSMQIWWRPIIFYLCCLT
jgi:hypothetical protein